MTYEADLLELRAGALTFDQFAVAHAARFRRWAGYFIDRWRPPTLEREDLVQEALVEAWRSVDTWDSARGVELPRFVEYRVGRKLRVECERALGWPDKRRGYKPIRPLSLFTKVGSHPLNYSPSSIRFLSQSSHAELEEAFSRVQGAARLELEEALARVPGGLRRDAVAGVALGMPLHVVAAHLFADPGKRVEYGFASREEAVRMVRREIRQQAKVEKKKVSTRVSIARA